MTTKDYSDYKEYHTKCSFLDESTFRTLYFYCKRNNYSLEDKLVPESKITKKLKTKALMDEKKVKSQAAADVYYQKTAKGAKPYDLADYPGMDTETAKRVWNSIKISVYIERDLPLDFLKPYQPYLPLDFLDFSQEESEDDTEDEDGTVVAANEEVVEGSAKVAEAEDELEDEDETGVAEDDVDMLQDAEAEDHTDGVDDELSYISFSSLADSFGDQITENLVEDSSAKNIDLMECTDDIEATLQEFSNYWV